MLVGVISDTHNRVQRTESALNILQQEGVAAIFHCGDVTGEPTVRLILNTKVPSYFVYGNNDDPHEISLIVKSFGGFDMGYSGIVELGDRKIGMAHGDRPALLQQIAYEQPDYVLFGHSHLATDFQQGKSRFINPGALHRAPKWTFVTLDLANDKLKWHELKE